MKYITEINNIVMEYNKNSLKFIENKKIKK